FFSSATAGTADPNCSDGEAARERALLVRRCYAQPFNARVVYDSRPAASSSSRGPGRIAKRPGPKRRVQRRLQAVRGPPLSPACGHSRAPALKLLVEGAGRGRARRFNDDEHAAPILRPGGFVVAGVSRAILAETDGIDKIRIQAGAHQGFTHGEGTAFAQRTIIFFG